MSPPSNVVVAPKPRFMVNELGETPAPAIETVMLEPLLGLLGAPPPS
jgi:hypothetical protein